MPPTNNYPFRNLIFEGGGVLGIAYVGAMQALQDKGILDGITRVGGASAGAIFATILALNYNQDEIEKLLWNLDFKNFLDSDWGLIGDAERLVKDFGWYKGDYFRSWMGSLIKARTGNSESTFADMEAMKDQRKFRSLYLMGTNLSTGFSEVFSPEHTPRMCVADAVRISMSFPLFFTAKRSVRGDVYVDGGVLDNYPVKLFDRDKYVDIPEHQKVTEYYRRVNEAIAGSDRPIADYVYNMETLGFRLSTREEISLFRDHAAAADRPMSGFFDYARALIEAFLDAQGNDHLHSDDWQRTIYIDTQGVKTLDFGLSDDRKQALVASGISGVKDYFQWYDEPSNQPANRP